MGELVDEYLEHVRNVAIRVDPNSSRPHNDFSVGIASSTLLVFGESDGEISSIQSSSSYAE